MVGSLDGLSSLEEEYSNDPVYSSKVRNRCLSLIYVRYFNYLRKCYYIPLHSFTYLYKETIRVDVYSNIQLQNLMFLNSVPTFIDPVKEFKKVNGLLTQLM